MTRPAGTWDWLIVTASNDQQAQAYERQLALRRPLGLLAGVEDVLVVADPGGRRIGSGGSTVYCLLQVLRRRLSAGALADRDAWRAALRRMRVLIVHAGGDSRRLPAYGPCGKLFVPVPSDGDVAVPMTLFDRQLPTYLRLGGGPRDGGQVVIVSGDVLLGFDPQQVRLDRPGMVGLACPASPKQASRHGVYCPGPEGRVRLFLQKPSVEQQREAGAIDRFGQSMLDIGVISFDADAAVSLLDACTPQIRSGALAWTGPVGEAIEGQGMDFYREVCCALGDDATAERHIAGARAGGSKWPEALLKQVHAALADTPFGVEVLSHCDFLHFGTTAQIISSGYDLQRSDTGVARTDAALAINCVQSARGGTTGGDSWVEACRLQAPLTLGGRNVVVGLDVPAPLDLPAGACVDVLAGRGRGGGDVWFVRCYGVDDAIKTSVAEGTTYCHRPVLEWLTAVGAAAADVWETADAGEQSLWNARLFPAASRHEDYLDWLWVFDPASASDAQKQAWRQAERYSLEEIALLTDQEAFHRRRAALRGETIAQSLRRLFRPESAFSAAELAWALQQVDDRAAVLADLLAEARWYGGDGQSRPGLGALAVARILHSLGSALLELAGTSERSLADVAGPLAARVPAETRAWLKELGIVLDEKAPASALALACRQAAFAVQSRAIVSSGLGRSEPPRSALRKDEIVWGRAPARLDLGGGWSDTPPYALERGGSVLNAAVNLNGQPPIHCYARVIDEPVIRIASIDLGTRVEVATLDDLWDYRSPTSEFALAKAALAISGFSPHAAHWPDDATLARMLEIFGGGIELTTLAAIPKGSGLGTSSIVGSVILAVVQRLFGRQVNRQELFHGVLRLEQALTTGGGWQDQIGGSVDGVKIATSPAGLIPDATIHYVPADVLDPQINGGCTLLYYTGITRLAKNILQQVVGRYLDRDRPAVATLRQIHALPPRVADAMSRKDLAEFGRLVDTAWTLNKQLDPNSTNEAVERLLGRVQKHVHGAKLLGAGGGGFLLMICRSAADAAAVRDMLTAEPPNELARFFDFSISREGLVVTVC